MGLANAGADADELMTDNPHLRAGGAVLTAALVGATLAVCAPPSRAAGMTPRQVIVGYRVRSGPAVRIRGVRRFVARSHTARPDVATPHTARPHVTVRTRIVDLHRGERLAAALRRLRRRPGVAYALPDYVARAAGAPFYPDDRGRSGRPEGWERMQWNLLSGAGGIDAPQAWSNLLADGRAGGSGVRIAVLDTGVAYRDWGAFRESPDLRGTRFVDPYDFIDHDRFPLDRDGHGTLVASVIGEATNNGLGLTGLAYGATIMPVRVLSANGLGDETTVADGIRYAVAHHAQIINLSLEFVPDQVHSAAQIPQVVAAIRDARRHGVMVIAASGNDQARQIAYPARVPGVVSVGATTEDGCLASYSNVGTGLDLVAPGGGSDALLPSDPACHPGRNLPPIYQMTLDDTPHWGRFGYPSFYIGTSMAVPEVAGAAALVIASGVLGRHPTSDQVLARLEQTATPLPAGGRQPNSTYGWGLLNVGLATSPLVVPTNGDPSLGGPSLRRAG